MICKEEVREKDRKRNKEKEIDRCLSRAPHSSTPPLPLYKHLHGKSNGSRPQGFPWPIGDGIPAYTPKQEIS